MRAAGGVFVIVVPMLAPMIIGTACSTDSVPEPTTATIVAVVVLELCTMTVNRTPMASPAKGFETPVKSSSFEPIPAVERPWMALLISSMGVSSKVPPCCSANTQTSPSLFTSIMESSNSLMNVDQL